LDRLDLKPLYLLQLSFTDPVAEKEDLRRENFPRQVIIPAERLLRRIPSTLRRTKLPGDFPHHHHGFEIANHLLSWGLNA
jgi:hypothetical protein